MTIETRVKSIRALATLILLFSVALAGASEETKLRTVTILHTNDMHAQLRPDDRGRGGMANVAAYLKKTRRGRKNVLVLDAGDMTQGSPVSSVYLGKPIFEIMNAMGYDAATLGNHEFDNGHELVEEFRQIARFPILSATAFHEDRLVADAPSRVFEVNGVRVAVIGLTTRLFVPKTLTIIPAKKALTEQMASLRGRADIYVALSHLGVKADLQLATQVEGLDLIVSGHSHTALGEPLTVGKTLIVQTGSKGRFVGRVELSVDLASRKIVSSSARLVSIPVKGLKPDIKTREVVDKWEAKVAKRMDVKIGRNQSALSGRALSREFARVWKEVYSADFGYQNNGGTRAPLPEGDLLERHIWNALPFANTLVILQLDRDQIAEQIGLSTFLEKKPLYSLITNSYIADEIIDKFNLSPERIRRTGVSHRQTVVDYIKKHGSINKAAPVAAGR